MTDRAGRAWIAGGVVSLALAAALAAMPRPQLDNRPEVWFPEQDPRLATWRTFVERFQGDEAVVVVVEGRDALLVLRLACDASDALAQDPSVLSVTSAKVAFPTEVETLLAPDLGGLDNLRFVGAAFDGPLGRALRLWEPGPAGAGPARATVLATLRPGRAEERAGIAAALAPLRERARAEGLTLRAVGQPLVNVALDGAARDIESRSMPVLVLVVVVVLAVAARSVRLAVALLVPVGLGVLATDGVLSAAGASTNLVVAIVKPLVLVVLLAAGLHVVVAFGDERRKGVGARAAAEAAARSRAHPVLVSLATSAIGFGSLIVSSIGPVQTFGVLATAAMVVGAPLILGALPLLLALLGGGAVRPEPSGLGRACAALVAHGRRRAWAWLGLTAAFVVFAAWTAARLVPQPHAIEYFLASSPMRREFDQLVAEGTPTGSIEALVTLAAPIGSDAAALGAIDAFAGDCARLPGVHAAVGLPLLLREQVHRGAHVDRLPAQWVVAEAVTAHAAELRPFVQDGGRLLRVSLPCDSFAPDAYDATLGAVEAAFARHVAPAAPAARLELTGSYGLLLATQRTLLSTLGSSLGSTAAMMVLVLVGTLRKVRLSLSALPSNLLCVSSIFVAMGLAHVPLDVGTCMTAAIALGIAADNTMHLLHGVGEHGLDETARSTGRAAVITAAVVGLGFCSLLGSDFGPTRNFGLLSATAVAAALWGDLVVLPATLEVLRLDDRGHARVSAAP